MKKNLFFVALAALALASCSDDTFVGENSPNLGSVNGDGGIHFGFDMQNATRAGGDIYGASAAEKLGGHFYVIGTKGSEGPNNPSETLVFDNYSVSYTANTAGTTASNTANWEYVGVASVADRVKLSPNAQTIKYWDYSTAQYDFHAFSTGQKKSVSGTSGAADEIGVTKSKYGTGLAGSAVAYTFDVPNWDCLKNLYITDITPVTNANYGKDVKLKFKNLGAKIRIALYETVPGYSIQAGSVKFYASATTPTNPSAGGYVTPTTTGTLISTDANGLPLKGTIKVMFPNVGTSSPNANHNKASVDVEAGTGAGSSETTKTFGTIPTSEMVTAQANETAGQLYIGRSLPDASFVGDPNADFYQLTFPVDDSHPLTLRVDYTLISTDGSNETITVHGANAIIPSTYTKWQPNYAYTYIFKISDNTNGTTDYATEGLTAITFDAVVADFVDVSGEQQTITTVATPSITTYQQNHADYATADEYDKSAAKNIYVQVKKADGSLAADLNGTTGDGTDKSILFEIPAGTTEAVVMDALQQRTTAINAADVTGRNGITLTKSNKISNTATSIVNGVDDNPITGIATGKLAEIDIALAAGTYAYVYDYSAAAKNVVTEFQPVSVTPGSAIDGTSKEYYPITIAGDLAGVAVTGAEEPVDHAYIYFSKTTTDGGTTYTYSYISVANKTTVPKGVVKLAKTVVAGKTPVAGTTSAVTGTFYFDHYFSNNGDYAVKVIKVVD